MMRSTRVAREDRHFRRRLPCLAPVGSSTVSGVLAFAVLADDHPVE